MEYSKDQIAQTKAYHESIKDAVLFVQLFENKKEYSLKDVKAVKRRVFNSLSSKVSYNPADFNGLTSKESRKIQRSGGKAKDSSIRELTKTQISTIYKGQSISSIDFGIANASDVSDLNTKIANLESENKALKNSKITK